MGAKPGTGTKINIMSYDWINGDGINENQVLCPSCEGKDPDCAYCDGEFYVPKHQAKDYEQIETENPYDPNY